MMIPCITRRSIRKRFFGGCKFKNDAYFSPRNSTRKRNSHLTWTACRFGSNNGHVPVCSCVWNVWNFQGPTCDYISICDVFSSARWDLVMGIALFFFFCHISHKPRAYCILKLRHLSPLMRGSIHDPETKSRSPPGNANIYAQSNMLTCVRRKSNFLKYQFICSLV